MNIYKAAKKARKRKRFYSTKKIHKNGVSRCKDKTYRQCRMLYSFQEQQALCKSLESVRRGFSRKRLDYSRLEDRSR